MRAQRGGALQDLPGHHTGPRGTLCATAVKTGGKGDLKGEMLMDPSAFNASICCSAEGNPFTQMDFYTIMPSSHQRPFLCILLSTPILVRTPSSPPLPKRVSSLKSHWLNG